MCETASNLRGREDNAKQKHEVYDELKLELNTPRENCVRRERKQFMVAENLERLERLNRGKDGEISSFIIELPAEKICLDEATPLGAVAVWVESNLSKKDDVKSVVEEVDFVDNVNFLETGHRSYDAEESVKDVAIGVGLSRLCS